jgi:polar amino acid transport system substrate-binding protein
VLLYINPTTGYFSKTIHFELSSTSGLGSLQINNNILFGSATGGGWGDLTSFADLKAAKLGAAVGTTSLDAIESQLGLKPSVFNDNAAGVSALKNKQIDGLVVDLPTAFYLSGVEVENGIIVGQLPSSGSGDQFGLLLTKGSALTSCVSGAVDAITADGTLDSITDTWLATNTGSPVLKP